MRVNSLIDLLGIVSIATNQASTIEEASQDCIDAICRFTGWPVGHLYLTSHAPTGPADEILYPTSVWHINRPKRFADFKEVTEITRFPSGRGLPGRVYAARKSQWLIDILANPSFPRAAIAKETGIRTALGFPILTGSAVAGVLEFFSLQVIEPDKNMLDVMSNIGAQLGRVIERERSREALRASEQKFRSVTQSATDAIVSANLDGVITSWNRGAQAIFGYSEEEALGQPFTLLIPNRYINLLAEGVEQPNSYISAVEIYCKRKDNTEFPVELSVASWESGGEISYSGIIRDITERKLQEEALRNSESRYRLVFEQASDGIFIFDHEANFVDANPHALAMIGYSLEDLRKLNIYDTIHPDQLAENPVHENQVLAGQVVDNERRMLRRDGTVILVESTTKLLDDGRILALVRDVTEKRRAAEAIRQLNQELELRVKERTVELEEAVQIREELLQVVSHDLRNPLAGITGNVRYLHNQITAPSPPDRQKLEAILARIRGASDKMQRLIDELLDFGRLQSGQMLSLQRKSVDLVRLANNATDQIQNTSSLHRIRFETDIPALIGFWDASRLDRVLDNLLSNAIKYSPNGGEVVVQVAADTIDGATHALLTVRDEGLGIAADELTHIFEWFRRGPKHSGRISGAGIGLANSRQIVEQHGGKITVTSQEGTGSSFTISLPLSPPEPNADPTSDDGRPMTDDQLLGT